jgi:hypothetical protein
VLGTGSSSSGYLQLLQYSDALILADADALWPRMIRVCDGPSDPPCRTSTAALSSHGSIGNANDRGCIFLSRCRLAVNGYVIHRCTGHQPSYPSPWLQEWGECHKRHRTRRHEEGRASSGCGLLHLFMWHIHSAHRLMLISNQTDLATSRQPPSAVPLRKTSLLHPGGRESQQWQLALRQW